MPTEEVLSHQSFMSLAKELGLDAADPRMEDLYPFVRDLLAGLKSLRQVDVGGTEPDMAFIPQPE